MTMTRTRMAMVFSEWAKRYADNPSAFSDVLSEDGQPVEDYGECCALYFEQLADEMDAAGLLSRSISEVFVIYFDHLASVTA